MNQNEEQPISAAIGRKLSVTIIRQRGQLKHDKATQSKYRESEAQTVPWTPEVVFKRRSDGAVVTLERLTPGDGPIGPEGVVLMERARQKQAWEDALPRAHSKQCNAIRRSCMMSIAVNEMAFREARLCAEHEERLLLSRAMLKESQEEILSKLQTRLECLKRKKRAENSAIIRYRKRLFKRNMRKLTNDRRNLVRGKTARDTMSDKASLKEYHSSTVKGISSFLSQNEDGSSRYLVELTGIALLEKQIASAPKPKFPRAEKSREICSRALRHMENELEKLQSERKGKHLDEKEPGGHELPQPTLRQRIRYSHYELSADELREMEKREKMDEVSLLLGKVVKGRAVQSRLLMKLIELGARKFQQSPLIIRNSIKKEDP